MTKTAGGCLCGAVRYEFAGTPLWSGYCHCESCRRATGAPVAAFVGVSQSQVEFTGEPPGVFPSSAGVERWFCSTCGSPLAYVGERWPDEVHLYTASLDAPALQPPRFHVNCREQLPWLVLGDTLPRFAITAVEG
jgi:hypothetical protein